MADAPYTLTQVSKKTGISMPTLQRYKKLHQDRIPSEGSGRTQRYPEEALPVFEEIKKENLKKRGRPPKKASSARSKAKSSGRKKRAARGKKASSKKTAKRSKRSAAKGRAGGDQDLLSLSEIGRRTGISYPTLLRYVKLHLDRIPHEGTGRKRRYPVEAVEVFRELRASSRRGRKKGSGTAKPAAAKGSDSTVRRLKALESSQARLEKKVDRLIKKLSKPLRIV